jgi:hypothetical protein
VLINSPVNIDEVVGQPSMRVRFGAALLTARRVMLKLAK